MGILSKQQFVDGIIRTNFKTTEAELQRVFRMFDKDHNNSIDYYEFVAALYPSKNEYDPETDADKIEDEVVRQVAKCKCCKKFQLQQVSENKYRFGEALQLRLVRVLRSVVMVRVGGGWVALDEFLIKNDPCRAKGRTNQEIYDKTPLPVGASQSMTAFRKRPKTPRTPKTV